MSKLAKSVVVFVLAVVVAFAAGNLSGLYFYPKFVLEADDHAHAEDDHAHDEPDAHDHATDDHDEEDEEDHVALTKQAFDNLNLQLGFVKQGEYWKTRTIPGEVIEVPGKSDLSVPAPVSGVIEEVLVRQGQSLGPEARLLSMRITDQNLTESQSKLLAAMARQEIVREEIARLSPLTDSGAVSGRAKRDLEYELKQLAAEQNTRMQEIRARGLPESVLNSIMKSRSLADKLTIELPTFTNTAFTTRNVSLASPSAQKNYSIERLNIHPGKSVQRGDDLCTLAYHADLQIEGTAFESDLAVLKNLIANDWPVTAEFGHVQHEGHSHRMKRNDLQLLHINNHVDRESQTLKFFLPLRNEVEQSLADEDGRTYLQWTFKPGQRVHLRLPVERWENQLIVPLDAVVVEGPNAFVFAEHVHDEDVAHDHDVAHDQDATGGHDETTGHDHDVDRPEDHDHDHPAHDNDEHDIFVELEPIPVRLLYRDSEVAVIADDGQIHLDDRIALNNAFKLHLAQKMNTGGGAAHHHDH